MHKLRISGILAALSLVLVAPSTASAERDGEFGVFGGAHIFNDDNELGVFDEANADSLANAIAFGIRMAWEVAPQLDFEGELALIPTTGRDSGIDVVTFGWRGHALYHILDGDLKPFALLGAGALTSSSEDERIVAFDTDFVLHGGVGIKYDVEDNWGVRCDARLLLPPSSASESLTTDMEFFLGLYKSFGDEPEEKKAAPADDDEDGIANDDDKCPSEAEDKDMFEDEDGCPEADNDGDGVPDERDQCPLLAEDKDGFEDEDGCEEIDNDGDGITDEKEQCPTEPEDKDGFEDEDGCPDKDNDGDGIADANDMCPLKPENFNGYHDRDGCEDVIPEKVQAFSGTIQGIRFQSGKATIRRTSFKVLDEAVAVFQEFEDVRVEVQGHTDNEGPEDVNTKLSQDRAQAVVDYFVSKGIPAERFVAKGYGPTVPKADNATKAGRDENRRVEFKLID